jgi:hypothetical protein
MHSGKLSGIFRRSARYRGRGRPRGGRRRDAAESDAVPSDSVYVVEARSAGGAIKRGSAVAIGRDMLLTNCHVTRAATHIQVAATATRGRARCAPAMASSISAY